MFTGIITTLGTVVYLDKTHTSQPSQGLSLGCTANSLDFTKIQAGSSIAVNGVCLTVTHWENQTLFFDVSHETLAKTNLRFIELKQQVNLEPAVKFGDSLDGHLVSGHVDGLAEVMETYSLGKTQGFVMKPPADVLPFIAMKGSICLDGVSLTVNRLYQESFVVDIIPFTRQQTIIQYYNTGYQANIEVDLIARYVARLIQSRN